MKTLTFKTSQNADKLLKAILENDLRAFKTKKGKTVIAMNRA
ncbi:hypothetical protein [Rubrolithibacter danxiaensis]